MVEENINLKKNQKPKMKINSFKKSTKTPSNKMRRIRLFFNQEDKNTIKKWFGCARKTYNWALSCIKNNKKEYKTNLIWLRKRFINKCNIPKNMQYLLDCPKEIRDGAISDLVSGIKINNEKRKENKDFKFDMKFRSKKDNQSIYIGYHSAGFNKSTSNNLKNWNDGQFKFYPSTLKSMINFYTRNKDKNNITAIPKYDCRLVMDKLGRIYLHIPVLDLRCENQTSKFDWCAIDPGVRTMMSIYSSTSGICYKIGDKDISRIIRLCYHIDKLISKSTKLKGRKKRIIKKVIQKYRYKIKHLIDDVHWKAINFLVNNFKTIILPTYNTSQMVKKGKRKINNKSVRMMLCWRFYAFKQRLLQKAIENNVKIVNCTEEYTSKTCSYCHNVKNNLGGNKVYKCKKCNLIIDRDINAARNIFIKNIKCSEVSN